MPQTKKKLPIKGILFALLLSFVAVGVGAILAMTTVVLKGSATLANGSQVEITTNGGLLNSGFDVASNNGTTKIEAGRYVVEFIDSTVAVNGVEAGTLDSEAREYELVVDRRGLRLISGNDTFAEVD